jgi:hypothetical protein
MYLHAPVLPLMQATPQYAAASSSFIDLKQSNLPLMPTICDSGSITNKKISIF